MFPENLPPPAPTPSSRAPPCSRAAPWKPTRPISPRSATRRRWRAAKRSSVGFGTSLDHCGEPLTELLNHAMSTPPMGANCTNKSRYRGGVLAPRHRDEADGPLDCRVDEWPAHTVRMGDRIFGHEGEADIRHDHGLNPVFALRAEPCIELHAHIVAYAHDLVAHLARQPVDIGLFGKIT